MNKFRGDVSLLQGGLDWLEQHTDKSVLGVVPYLTQLKLDAEDAIEQSTRKESAQIRVKVPVLKRISNHTDFDPLKWHEQVDFSFVGAGESLAGADLIILPGSKNVREDLAFIIQQGWDSQIKQHLRYGGKLLGICGGLQMLGKHVADPLGIEGTSGTSEGLQLLDFHTKLAEEKQLKQISGHFNIAQQAYSVSGYEIHCGLSEGPAMQLPFATITDQNNINYQDGVRSDDGQIIGSYIHGLFENKHSLKGLLHWVSGSNLPTTDWHQVREAELERLADALELSLNFDQIIHIIESTQINGSAQSNKQV